MSDKSTTESSSITNRLRANSRPAAVWVVVAVALVAVEFGAIMGLVMAVPWHVLPAIPGGSTLAAIGGRLAELPTLLSRNLIGNQGYHLPTSGWQGTFLGLPPAFAWILRVLLVYAYAWLACRWIWHGYKLYKREYRNADWTPRDDMVRRFSNHQWGKFGLYVVLFFLVFAVFAPTLGPAPVDQNIKNPYSAHIKYHDSQTGTVKTVTAGTANLQSKSTGKSDRNIGPLKYDDYGRFHPFGTMTSGADLFTFLAAGARVSLFIGILALSIGCILAVVFALVTAYYKGLIDLIVVLTSDSIMSLPQLMIMILLSKVFANTWLEGVYNGGLLLALIMGVTYWPYLWRTIRGPTMQVSNQGWVDAARSFGQRPHVTMRNHMFPYVLGYLLVYASMSLGGVILAVAGLSFLGIGVNPPTPEWGRAVADGQQYVTTASWHISLIPGLLIVLVVTAFNALGDGIRDAIDPHSATGSGEDGDAASAEASAAGGGGA